MAAPLILSWSFSARALPKPLNFSQARKEPPRSTDNRTAWNYLTAARRIDEDVTGFFLASGDIYEEAAAAVPSDLPDRRGRFGRYRQAPLDRSRRRP